ncbi:MAG: efflux RND transporter periplasmic adaptor subunit [Geminicoccaceae bacterium]
MDRRLFGSLPLLGLLVLAACDGEPDGSANGATPPPPPAVTVAQPLQQKLIEQDEFTGRFEAVERVEVRARVAGYMQEVHFTDGQIVEKGQLLFVIDPRPFELALDRAKAQLEEAESRLTLAQLEADRTTKLVSTSAVARAALDQRVAERQSSEASLSAAQAAVRDAELNLGFTRVTSPLTGRASNRRVDVGNLVNDTTLLTTVVQLEPLYLVFDMSESDYLAYQRAVLAGTLPSTRDATPVQVRLTDETGWPHEGTMNFVDNVVDQGTGTLRARAVVPNPDHLITPGQFARIRIPGSPEYEALLIPDAAIVTDQARKMVLTVSQDGTVVPKEIRPGPSQPGGLRIVRSGLDPADRIIISGMIKARPGGKVTPEEGKIEPVQQASAG